MVTQTQVINDIYMMRRFNEVNRSQVIPAELKLDIARSPFDDDEIEEQVGILDPDAPAGQGGFGVAQLMQEFLSRNPDKQPVGDLKTMQQRLVDQGYVHQSTPVDGVWSPSYASAFRRAERDAFDQYLSGKRVGSTSMQQAISYLGYMAPAGVWQGIVGTAKGIVAQAPETVENLGFFGGVAAGAAIGSAFGPGVGTVVGAAIGGAAGFLGDLFGEDEPEDESGISDFLDALTPFEEYTGEGGAENFFSDLNLVLTAATLISGTAMAAQGARVGIASIGSAVRSGVPIRNALLTKTAVGQPGMFARAATSTKAPLYGAAIGGVAGGFAGDDLGDVVTGAAIGGMIPVIGKYAGGPIRNFIERRGLLAGEKAGKEFLIDGALQAAPKGASLLARKGLVAQTSRPLIKTVNNAFTGLSAGQLGSRAISDILPGVSKVEETIEAEPRMPGADLFDWFGLVIYPSQLFTVRGGQIAERMVESKWLRQPFDWAYDIALQGTRDVNGKMLNRFERRTALRKAMSPTGDENDAIGYLVSDIKLTTEAGRDFSVESALVGKKFEPGSYDYLQERWNLRNGTNRAIKEEWRAITDGELTSAPLTDDLASWRIGAPDDSLKGQTAYAAWVKGLEGGRGRGVLEGMQAQIQAEKVVTRLNAMLDQELVGVAFGKKAVATPGTLIVRGAARKIPSAEYDNIKGAIGDLRKKADKVDVLNAADPVAAQHEKGLLLQRADELQRQLESIPATEAAPKSFTVANLADEARGIPATATEQEIDEIIDVLKGVGKGLKRGAKDIDKASDPVAIGKQVDELRYKLLGTGDNDPGILKNLLHRDVISEKMYVFVRDGLDRAKILAPTSRGHAKIGPLINHLKKVKGFFPQRVENVDQILGEIGMTLPEGKTLVMTGEDIIRWDEVPKTLAAKNIDLFNAQPTVFDTISYWTHSIGFAPHLQTDHALFRFRQAHQETSVNDRIRAIEDQLGVQIPLTGKQVVKRVRDGMQEFNGGEGVIPANALLHRKVETGAGLQKGRFQQPLLDIRQVKRGQLKEWLELEDFAPSMLDPDDFALEIFDALKQGSALGSEMSLMNPIDSMRSLAKNLRVDGLPGAVDWMRMWHIKDPRRAGGVAGAVAGGVAGAVDAEGGVNVPGGILGGALLGGFAGASLGQLMKMKFPKGTYGYLPDYLHRASMAMRYTFSLAFDLGRYMENATIGMTKEGLPFVLRADHFIKKQKQGWKSLLGEGRVYGDDAMREALHVGNILRGRGNLEAMDEMMVWMFQRGILGYSPRLQESARAYMMVQRDLAAGKVSMQSLTSANSTYMRNLEKRVRSLEGYGIGRRTMEKSVNFIFFPFSFQKKLLGSLGDFITQAPARALLIHEGLRSFYSLGLNEQAGDFIEKYVPLANQLKRLNNLAYGISPGRFFLEGIRDHRTPMGTISQALGSIFVPSGANTPAAQLFGGLGDAAVHLFAPVVVTGESGIEEARDAIVDFVPAIRDIARFKQGAEDQLTALTSGTAGAPYYQLQQYLDGRREAKARWSPVAQLLGYADVDGFLSSTAGATIKAKVDQEIMELGAKYRKGQQMANEFENTQSINAQALFALASKEDRSPAEDVVLEIAHMDDVVSTVAEVTGLETDVVQAFMSRKIRSVALQNVADREFAELYDRFFSYEYGPITRMAV